MDCTWTVTLTSTPQRYQRIETYLESFQTEKTHDKLTIGTKEYHGTYGDGDQYDMNRQCCGSKYVSSTYDSSGSSLK